MDCKAAIESYWKTERALFEALEGLIKFQEATGELVEDQFNLIAFCISSREQETQLFENEPRCPTIEYLAQIIGSKEFARESNYMQDDFALHRGVECDFKVQNLRLRMNRSTAKLYKWQTEHV